MEMQDFRGNSYKEEKLTMNGLPIPCELCLQNQAVRNVCIAEGDFGRTHWHGGIHILRGGPVQVCKECADKENKLLEERIDENIKKRNK